jgi:hypothetical protein
MRRSPVKVGALGAAILFSSIAYAEQPKAPSQAYLAQTPEACQHQDPKRATWTLFLVAVPYNGPWTFTAVAAFSIKDNTKDNKDMACSDCFDALAALNNGNPNYRIPGLVREIHDATKAEGTAQYLTCLPATAPSQRGAGSGDAGSQHSDD